MARESKECIHEKILTAAEKRFWHYGIRKTTIDEIAADAEVGKGTVYLHFESKEQIAAKIIAQYKQQTLADQEEIASDSSQPLLQRLTRILSLPIERTTEHCRTSPMVVELVSVVRLQFSDQMSILLHKELSIIQGLLDEGNADGQMHVADTAETARLLKRMTLGYMPPSYITDSKGEYMPDISSMLEMVYQGLR